MSNKFLTGLMKAGTTAGDVLTTKGDILSRTTSALGRLGIGSDDQVLTADSTTSLGVAWSTVGGIPSGVILMWSGLIAAIPSGWVICDGNNSTPNLLAKFIRCVATDSTEAGTTGGADSVTLTGAQSGTSAHSHSINDSGHTHTYAGNATSYTPRTYAMLQYQAGYTGTTNSSTTGITINDSSTASASSSHENMPAYYELIYIMKS